MSSITELLSKEQRISAFSVKYDGRLTIFGFRPYIGAKDNKNGKIEVRINDENPLEPINLNNLWSAFSSVGEDATKNFGASPEKYGSEQYSYHSRSAKKPAYYSTSLVFGN